MNIFIFADIEGISGIYSKEQVTRDGKRFQEGRDFMTADINACAEGCKKAGADRVVVCDGHGVSYSVRWEKLSPAVDEVICGDRGDDRLVDIEEFDGVILLGYHAMAGTYGAVLEHSMSSARIQNYWINGKKAGEVAIDAGIAGEHGVPVIMVSGDDKVCAEAKALLPWIKTAQVKRGLSSFGAVLLPPQKAHDIIRDSAEQAVRDIGSMRTLVYPSPVTFKVELMERQPLPNIHSRTGMTVIDGRTYEIEAPTIEEAFFRS